MYERAFGKLLHSNEDISEEQQSAVMPPDVASSGSARSKTSMTTANTMAAMATDGKEAGTTCEGEKNGDAKKGKNSNNNSNTEATTTTTTNPKSKSVQFQRAGGSGAFSQDSADDSSPSDENPRGGTSRSRASAREARSRRRQAMIDDTTIIPGTEILAGKRKLPAPPGGHRSKQYKFNGEPQYGEDGEVVKVKLLTGTLYLYRGAQRRAEWRQYR